MVYRKIQRCPLCGNSGHYDDDAGTYDKGDRVGVLLNLDDGSLRFFKNGAPIGPGFPAGSVTEPVWYPGSSRADAQNVDDSVSSRSHGRAFFQFL
jgi:hypothetical protein